MVSSRYLPRYDAYVVHLSEFRFLRDYLDTVQYFERDASEEVMERILQWNRAHDLGFRVKTGEFNRDIRPEYLSAVKSKLYSDQLTGVRWLAARPRSLLADSMGIGKSLQALATFSVWRSLQVAERGLVVSLSGVKPSWENEVNKHTNFSVTVLPNGTKAILDAIEVYRRQPTDFLVIHYEGLCQQPRSKTAVRDPETGNSEVIQALLQCPFDVIFGDEAHLLKNMDTMRYKSFAYLLANIQTSSGQALVEYETETGEIIQRVMSESAARHLEVNAEVDIL